MRTVTETWASRDFHAELEEWIERVAGPVRQLGTVKLRPWSTVWRAETARGVAYAKQNCPGQLAEAAVVAALVEVVPDRVVPLWAADVERGLLLTPDQGQTMRATRPAGDVALAGRLLREAAELQRDVAPYVERLAAAGLATMPPEDAATYAEAMVDRLAGLPADDPRALAPGTAARLIRHLPTLRACGDVLADAGLPVTLNHNDLHDNNVFAGRGSGDRLRFFDFGDAVLGEPLGMLRIPLDVLIGGDWRSATWRPALDHALEVWSDLVPVTGLRQLLPAALHVARLGRVESWWRCLGSFDEVELADFGSAPAQWLASLLDDDPVELPGRRRWR